MAEIDLDKIFDGTIAVHLTKLFPKKKRIRTRFSTNPLRWLRDTVHFSLNKPAYDFSAFQTGNLTAVTWSDCKFVILIPFDKLYKINGKNLQIFGVVDTIFTRSVLLPEGTLVLVLPDGISYAIENGVVSDQELIMNFGEMSSSFSPGGEYFEKNIEGIKYRIFNYHMQFKIKEVTIKAIKELGYDPNFFYDKPLREISDALGLEYKTHGEHWTSKLEDLAALIHNSQRNIDNFLSVIAKLTQKDVFLPILWNDFGERRDFTVFFEKGRQFTDAKGNLFYSDALKGLFDRNELDSIHCLNSSINDQPGISLQYPIEYAKSLLKPGKVPITYHKAIIFYVRGYQQYVKKRLPRNIILLCPTLINLLEEKI